MEDALKLEGTEGQGLKTLLEAYERQLIQSALEASAWNQRRAAAALGLLPTTLHEKMKRLGIPTARELYGGVTAGPVAVATPLAS